MKNLKKTDPRRAAEEIMEEVQSEAYGDEKTGKPFIVAHRNFDPAEMEDIVRLRLNSDNRAKFRELLENGYICYGVYYVRDTAGIYNYSHQLEAIFAKKKADHIQ